MGVLVPLQAAARRRANIDNLLCASSDASTLLSQAGNARFRIVVRHGPGVVLRQHHISFTLVDLVITQPTCDFYQILEMVCACIFGLAAEHFSRVGGRIEPVPESAMARLSLGEWK